MKAMKKQERIVRQRKMMLAAFIIIIAIIAALLFFSVNSSAEESKEVYKYYTSYQVKSGDTLWTIADQYLTPEHNDKEEYINEIKSINHIQDGNIKAGEYIVIAYYSYEEL